VVGQMLPVPGQELLFGVCLPVLVERLLALVTSDGPGFLPPFIPGSIAQGQYRIDIGALPSHPGALKTCFNQLLTIPEPIGQPLR